MHSSVPSCWGDETSWRGDGRELLCRLDWGGSSGQLHRLGVGDFSTNAHGVGKEYHLTRGDTQWVHQCLWFCKSMGTCCRPSTRLAVQTRCTPNQRLLQRRAFMLSLQTVPDGLADVERDGNAQSKSLPSSSRAEIGTGRSVTKWPLENLGEKQGTRSSSHYLGVKKWFPQSQLSGSGGKKIIIEVFSNTLVFEEVRPSSSFQKISWSSVFCPLLDVVICSAPKLTS